MVKQFALTFETLHHFAARVDDDDTQDFEHVYFNAQLEPLEVAQTHLLVHS